MSWREGNNQIEPFTIVALLFICATLGLVIFDGFKSSGSSNARSTSSVKKATVEVTTDPQGLTIEQKNVRDRLLLDNKVGSIKHLYIISPESGKILLYSTVKGKVTSSGKRLTPRTIVSDTDGYRSGFRVKFGKSSFYTNEVLEDDGTYGNSEPYIFWWDTKGIYHQHFLMGGQIVHVSDQPIRVNPNEIQLNLSKGE
jgi:hypothetical protein